MDSHTFAEQIAARIAALREAKGWIQKELAARIGVETYQVSKYESGRHAPRAETVWRLAETLGVTADYLLGGPRRRTSGEEDPRLRERLPRLERLPRACRDVLVLLFDALLNDPRIRAGGVPPEDPGRGEPRR